MCAELYRLWYSPILFICGKKLPLMYFLWSVQTRLRDRGVEVVEFDFLTPTAVAQYCATRGFLRCFWECGGTLSAPALASGTIHRVMAFVAPKIIGGIQSYTPVGNLGFVEMTQVHPLYPVYPSCLHAIFRTEVMYFISNM